MFDYAGWVRRAVAFTERLRTLPGEVEVRIEVEPPMSDADIAALMKKTDGQIPQPILRFWKEASARCMCDYYWAPPEPLKSMIGDLVKTASYLFGGACILGASDRECYLTGASDVADALRESGFMKSSKLWSESFPFNSTPSGDLLGIWRDEQRSEDDWPVAYLHNESGEYSGIIDDSFDSLLAHWERLYYISSARLSRFEDPETGRIALEAPNVHLLDAIFKTAGFA